MQRTAIAFTVSCFAWSLAGCVAQPDTDSAADPMSGAVFSDPGASGQDRQSAADPAAFRGASADPTGDPSAQDPNEFDPGNNPLLVQTAPTIDPKAWVGQQPTSVGCALVAKDGKPDATLASGQKRVAPSPRAQPFAHRPWTSGSTIAAQGDTITALDRIGGKLVRVDRKSLKISAIRVIGSRPHELVLAPNGTAYITLRDKGAVAILPPGADTDPMFVTVGVDPRGLALSNDAKRLYVAVTGQARIAVLDAGSGQVVAIGTVAKAPVALAYTSVGKLIIGHENGDATAVDAAKIAENSDMVAASLDKISTRVPLDHSLPECGVMNSKIGGGPLFANRVRSIAVDPGSGAAFVLHNLMQPSSEELAKQTLMTSTVSPDGEVKSKNGKTSYGGACRPTQSYVTVISATGESIATVRDFMNVKAVIEGISSAQFKTSSEPLSAWIDQPAALRHHPTHDFAMILGHGSDRALAMRLRAVGTQLRKEFVAAFHVGSAPTGIAFSGDGERAYVLSAHEFAISEVDLSVLVASKSTTPPTVPLAIGCRTRAVTFGADPLPAGAAAGRRIFTYAKTHAVSQNGQFACATCHNDGEQDAMVWHTPMGPRQTPQLAGRLVDTQPYNWRGSKHFLLNNMSETIGRMGGSGLTDKQRQQLEAFLVLGLQPAPSAKPSFDALNELEKTGRKLFFDAEVACSSCHLAGAGVDGKSHDVGTGGFAEKWLASCLADKLEGGNCSLVSSATALYFDTPSLRDVGSTAPYLHDGSAKTLMDVLEHTAGTMGDVTGLTGAQKTALVAYLRTL